MSNKSDYQTKNHVVDFWLHISFSNSFVVQCWGALLGISLVLFVLNLLEMKEGNSAVLGIISNILLIAAMVAVILDNKSKG